MRQIALLVEGQTEERVVAQVLAPAGWKQRHRAAAHRGVHLRDITAVGRGATTTTSCDRCWRRSTGRRWACSWTSTDTRRELLGAQGISFRIGKK